MQVATLLAKKRERSSPRSRGQQPVTVGKSQSSVGQVRRILSTTQEFSIRKVPIQRRVQEAGETYDQYRTALLKIAAGCEFEEKITRRNTRLMFGIRDNTVRERLL